MKKILIALLNVILMLSFMVGCGKKDDTKNPDDTSSNNNSSETENNDNESDLPFSEPELPWEGDPIELPDDVWE